MSAAPPHLCFYSARCRFSQAFLEELSRTPYAKEFRCICVDAQPGKPRPQLPAYLKAVPTLMIQGEPEPRTDNAVMNWLSERRLRDRTATGSASRSGLGGGSLDAPTEDGLMAFGGEMYATGDEGFAFLNDDTSTSTGVNVRLAGNMASLNDLHLMAAPESRVRTGPTASGGAAGPKESAKSKALNDSLEALRAARERDTPVGPRRM
jgi:hypothetical protein